MVEARRVGDRALALRRGPRHRHQPRAAARPQRAARQRRRMVDVAVSRMMGLVVVARLASRHGVKVELRPAADRGTVADVDLPTSVLVPRALAGRQQQPPALPAAGPQHGRGRPRPAFGAPARAGAAARPPQRVRQPGHRCGGRPFDPAPRNGAGTPANAGATVDAGLVRPDRRADDGGQRRRRLRARGRPTASRSTRCRSGAARRRAARPPVSSRASRGSCRAARRPGRTAAPPVSAQPRRVRRLRVAGRRPADSGQPGSGAPAPARRSSAAPASGQPYAGPPVSASPVSATPSPGSRTGAAGRPASRSAAHAAGRAADPRRRRPRAGTAGLAAGAGPGPGREPRRCRAARRRAGHDDRAAPGAPPGERRPRAQRRSGDAAAAARRLRPADAEPPGPQQPQAQNRQRYADETMELPIFRELESAWFRTRRPGPEEAAGSRTGRPANGGATRPSSSPTGRRRRSGRPDTARDDR